MQCIAGAKAKTRPLHQAAGAAWSAQRLYRPYVRVAIVVALSLGFSTGAGALLLPALGVARGTWWITHIQAHGAVQIFGWAGLFTMGLAWHVVPRFRNTAQSFPWPQRATLALVLAGIVMRFTGQTAPPGPASHLVAIAGAAAILGGVAVFVAYAGHTLTRGESAHGSIEPWLWAGMAWAVAAGVFHLAAVFQIPETGVAVAPISLDSAFVYAGVFGFLGNFAFGISQRAVVGLLGLRPTFTRLVWFAFAATNLGAAASVAARVSNADTGVIGLGMLIQSIGLAAIVVGLRVLEPAAFRRPAVPGTYPRYPLVVRAAYAWLFVAAVLMATDGIGLLTGRAPFANLAAPLLHAMALGFITTLIMGMSSRMLPLFEGAELPAQRVLDVAIGLHVVGLGLRVGVGLAAPSWSQPVLAASGLLGLVALALFAIPAWRVMGPSARDAYRRRAASIGAASLAKVTLVRRGKGAPSA